MKKRFFFISTIITTITIIIISFIFSSVSYNNKKNQTKEILQVYMSHYDDSYTFNLDGEKKLREKLNGLEITFINNDGKRCEDNIDTTNYFNYSDVLKAKDNDYGYCIKKYNKSYDKVYYTIKLENNNYVRMSLLTKSYISIYLNNLPTLITILIFGIIICALLSYLIIGTILKPVEKISRDGALSKETKTNYKELESICNIINKRNTEIKEKIDNIKKNKQIETMILDNMSHGILILSLDNNIISINTIAKKLLSVDEETTKINYFDNDTEIKEKINKKESFLIYRVFNNKDYALRFSFQKSACVVLLTDVTDIKSAERSKDDFIQNVTHEMNTPLTSIKGFAELIATNNLNEEKLNHACDVIINQVNRLSLLIKNIINYSSFENKDLPLYDVNVSEIVISTIQSLEGVLLEKNISITTDITSNITIKSRSERVIEVVTNLITNAIKYNKELGKINVILTKKDGKIILEVSDTGIGIEKENHKRIFDRFFTVDKSHNKKISGFGLGLAIVKKICMNSNWDITLESEINKGSKFTIMMR